jgi:hypothetical protein
MLPLPPRWTGWALTTLFVAAIALLLCLAAATQMTDTALRDALGKTYFYGTTFVVHVDEGKGGDESEPAGRMA